MLGDMAVTVFEQLGEACEDIQKCCRCKECPLREKCIEDTCFKELAEIKPEKFDGMISFADECLDDWEDFQSALSECDINSLCDFEFQALFNEEWQYEAYKSM